MYWHFKFDKSPKLLRLLPNCWQVNGNLRGMGQAAWHCIEQGFSLLIFFSRARKLEHAKILQIAKKKLEVDRECDIKRQAILGLHRTPNFIRS